MKAEHMFHRQTHPANPRSLLQQRSPQLQRGRWGGHLCEKFHNPHPRRNCKFKQIENHKKMIKNLDRCLDSQSHKHPSFHAPRIPKHHHHLIALSWSCPSLIHYQENLKHCGFAKISSCLSNPTLALPLLFGSDVFSQLRWKSW